MDKQSRKVKEPSMAKDDPERQARLAEALRANLRRRKAQARAAADEGATGDKPKADRHSREGGNP
jgi:hypothetical protein